MQPPRRVRKPPRRVRGGALEAPRSLLEDTLREGFVKAPRAPPFGNDSSDNDKPPEFIRGIQRLGRAGIRRFRPRGSHQNSPFRE